MYKWEEEAKRRGYESPKLMFESMQHDQLKSLDQIAVEFSCVKSTIELAFKKHNVVARPKGSISKAERYLLKNELTTELYTLSDLARRMGYKNSRVCKKALKRLGIPYLSHKPAVE